VRQGHCSAANIVETNGNGCGHRRRERENHQEPGEKADGREKRVRVGVRVGVRVVMIALSIGIRHSDMQRNVPKEHAVEIAMKRTIRDMRVRFSNRIFDEGRDATQAHCEQMRETVTRRSRTKTAEKALMHLINKCHAARHV
jgi:hypothetical protein